MKISADKEEHSYFNPNSSGLFLGIIFCLILFGILGLSIWVTEISKSSEKVNSKFESRLTILEEQLQLADSTSTEFLTDINTCLLYTSPSPRDLMRSRMPSSA